MKHTTRRGAAFSPETGVFAPPSPFCRHQRVVRGRTPDLSHPPKRRRPRDDRVIIKLALQTSLICDRQGADACDPRRLACCLMVGVNEMVWMILWMPWKWDVLRCVVWPFLSKRLSFYKLCSRKFTTQNNFHGRNYSKRVVIVIETRFMNCKCLQMSPSADTGFTARSHLSTSKSRCAAGGSALNASRNSRGMVQGYLAHKELLLPRTLQ